jgi:hypothetical protein
MAAEFTNSLDRNGRGGMLAPFRIADGVMVSPGLSFLNDADNGLWRSASDTWHAVSAGANVLTFSPGALTIPAGVAFNLSLTPTPNGWYSPNPGILATDADFVRIKGTMSVGSDPGGFSIQIRGRAVDNIGALQFASNSGANQLGYMFVDNNSDFHYYTGLGFASHQFVISHTANAVNIISVKGGIVGNAPSINAIGVDVDIPLALVAKGNAPILFYTGGNAQAAIGNFPAATNLLILLGGGNPKVTTSGGDLVLTASTGVVYTAGNNPLNAIGHAANDILNDIFVQNLAADGYLRYWTKGAGSHQFFTGGYGTGVPQFAITHTVGATNVLTVTGSPGNPIMGTNAGSIVLKAASGITFISSAADPLCSTGFSEAPGLHDIFAQNSASDSSIRLFSKGIGAIQFFTGGYLTAQGQAQVLHVAGTDRTLTLQGGAPGGFPTLSTTGGFLGLGAGGFGPAIFVTPANKFLINTQNENITGSGVPVELSIDGASAVYCIATLQPTTAFIGHQVFVNGNGIVGMISTNGLLTNYATSSDYRLKSNVVPILNGVEQVMKMRPVNFDWNSGGNGHGFIAHELQEYFPDAVAGEKDALHPNGTPKYQGVDSSMLVPWLCAAIQELHSRLQQLEP